VVVSSRRVEPLLQPHGTAYVDRSCFRRFSFGSLHGDTLAPLLFILVLAYALRRALDKDASLSDIKNGQWGFFPRHRKGLRSPALNLTDTDLADDIGLYRMTYDATQRTLDAVIRETKAAGLFINVARTKSIKPGDLVDTPDTITLDGVPIDRVEDLKHLGSYVGSVGRDIKERCKAASRAYGRAMPVWKRSCGCSRRVTCYVLCV
jgi:hypothetical protein